MKQIVKKGRETCKMTLSHCGKRDNYQRKTPGKHTRKSVIKSKGEFVSKKKNKKQPWITEEMLETMEERKMKRSLKIPDTG